MSDDAKNNRPASAAMPENQPPPSGAPQEREYLAQQAREAREGMARTLAEMRQTLKDTGDLRAWTRKYPWTSVGVAAAVGFLGARALSNSRRRESAQLLERVLADEEMAARLKEIATEEPPPSATLLGSLGSSLVRALAGSLEAALVAAVTARAGANSSANGHADDPRDEEPLDPSDETADPQ